MPQKGGHDGSRNWQAGAIKPREQPSSNYSHAPDANASRLADERDQSSWPDEYRARPPTSPLRRELNVRAIFSGLLSDAVVPLALPVPLPGP